MRTTCFGGSSLDVSTGGYDVTSCLVLSKGVCVWGGSVPGGGGKALPLPCEQTNTCKNITFPQLRWQAVITYSDECQSLYKSYMNAVNEQLTKRLAS